MKFDKSQLEEGGLGGLKSQYNIVIYKPNFQNLKEDIPGPYYDPYDNHIHKWVKPSLIKNFTIEQDPHKEILNIDKNFKNKHGLYCCICHKRRSGFISTQVEHKNHRILHEPYYNYEHFELKYGSKNKPSLNSKEILYNITPCETILIKEENMTYYQKFRHKYPNYKKDVNFILNDETFMSDYYVLH